MRRLWWLMVAVFLLTAWSGPALAQTDQARINQLLIKSYDLLEAGNLDQARAVFAEVLKLDPGNPLALNNLGAVMAKEKKYREALKYLEQALPRSKGYKVRINRVCAVGEVCLAYRPAEAVYGDSDLAPLVELNINLVKARLATRE
jgi:Flp pilus assembly protein TadD